ncbi:MAG: hypothetical protein ACR2L1_04555, partial [Pyrinomonadaceae bacterium]
MKNLKQFVMPMAEFSNAFMILFLSALISIFVNGTISGKSLTDTNNSISLTNTITGTVFDERRQPVPDIFVE